MTAVTRKSLRAERRRHRREGLLREDEGLCAAVERGHDAVGVGALVVEARDGDVEDGL